MRKTIQFGEAISGYEIPVLNEREIRAAAGLMFLATFLSLMFIIYEHNFVPIKYVVTVFFIDFCIRIYLSPRFSPILIIGRFIVSKQNPEYVGAAQKKFAWYIGLILSASMLVLMVFLNTYSIITGLVCLICLILMFFETAFGICIGCKIYKALSGTKAQYCPGEVCNAKTQLEIQKTSCTQWLIVIAFVVVIMGIAWIMNDSFKVPPTDLFELLN
ncbi:DUF4395 domain-containing protein [Flavobacterium sp. CYK-4]|uniref:DUF4395 domain-containing protein n=1 Tax=Flavobacterium lotistagni TaxID=2709660 RepID=UPI00140ACA90|nr:DUF4395 domain-containing protein [Flavobacterium lotistagni]NHM07580.1 DUF4395 domain-containing protein [Flavobacterium lotistagni]